MAKSYILRYWKLWLDFLIPNVYKKSASSIGLSFPCGMPAPIGLLQRWIHWKKSSSTCWRTYPFGHYGRSVSSYTVCYNRTPLQVTEYINLKDTGHILPSRRGLRRSRPATEISRVRNYIGALWSLPAFPFLAYLPRVTEPSISSTSILADVDFTIYNGSWSNCLGRGTARSRSSASTPLYTACATSPTQYSGITFLAWRSPGTYSDL